MTLDIVVSGMIAGVPGQGGAAWAVLQYVLGLQRLGHRVWFVEPVDRAALVPAGAPLADSRNAAYFRDVVRCFSLEQRSALVLQGTRETVGLGFEHLERIARHADLVLDISGMLTDEPFRVAPVRLYLDLDPAFNQLWHFVHGIDVGLDGHTHFATVGQAIGTPACSVPTGDVDWIRTLPPVVLDEWPFSDPPRAGHVTTVANWRSYGSIEHEGRFHGQKAHAFRQLMELPKHVGEQVTVALGIHPDETADLAALRENGWRLTDPVAAAGTPDAYRRFVQGSKMELGIAKTGYVVSGSGWFSDRSACYLASGRPVVAQDTGFSSFLPTGQGLLAFSTFPEAVAGIEAIAADPERHARAAREIAEDHLDSDAVLGRLLARVGLG